ncbi:MULTISPECIES: DUF6705 family protein [unclassified Flavobacterium]|uniref:DUF6705 family protein n=1 Tax=unclassified Flavobacterium TaxID=196869 RepID=UPI001290BCDD|nr:MULTISPECIES: DUF6705 family protein [unclassified Flavobacterium]MQP53688.1 hypothetical protein [Flavobacterium sp. LMO9]MQP63606.1 hypothetical protein [Flavobacterium sp. LMO6]
MKNIIKIVALILFSTVNGQITKPLENCGGVEENVYYKDFNNVLNDFEGTYEYNGPDFYFKLVLQKKIAENNNVWWTDLLKGSYQYIANGTEVNFLSDPMASDDNPARVQARWIVNGNPRYCPDCLQNQKWLRGYISDDTTNKSAQFFMAKKVVNGVEGLQLWLAISAAAKEPWESDNPIFLPIGEFFVRKL